MRVIGIDYDSHAVHFSILSGERVSTIRYHLVESLGDSLDALIEQVKNFRDDYVVVEAPIYIQNPKTSFKLARVHTLICVALEKAGVLYQIIEVTRWKRLALGKARANKQEVLEAMRARFGDIISDSHFADATAMAVAGKKLLEEVK